MADIDTTNRYFVALNGEGNLSIMLPHQLARGITKDDALNLAAWLTVLHACTDEEVKAHRDAVAST